MSGFEPLLAAEAAGAVAAPAAATTAIESAALAAEAANTVSPYITGEASKAIAAKAGEAAVPGLISPSQAVTGPLSANANLSKSLGSAGLQALMSQRPQGGGGASAMRAARPMQADQISSLLEIKRRKREPLSLM